LHYLRTFRLFVSSTFSDFKSERQTLQEKVFPKIDEYCQKRNFQFHPIDLRWGINAEAQANQKTLSLCLNEVKNCKQFPYPNFIILNGNRYGWVPLPEAIDKEEFDKIRHVITHDETQVDALKYLNYWYIEDSNRLSTISDTHTYILKGRERATNNNSIDPLFKKDFVSLDDKNSEGNVEWAKHESIIRHILQYAIDHLFARGEVTNSQRAKYFTSATEFEILAGVQPYADLMQYPKRSPQEHSSTHVDNEHVYVFNRHIEFNTSQSSNSAPSSELFFDENSHHWAAFKQRLEYAFPSYNCLKTTVDYADVSQVTSARKSYLVEFEEFMITRLIEAVEQHINDVKELEPLNQEIKQQLKYKQLFTTSFVGRTTELTHIFTYIGGSSKQPLLIRGSAGQGKTALIAKAADTHSSHVTCCKFIGASSQSSHMRGMLESLILELALKNCLKKPKQFETDIDDFYSQVYTLLKSITIPTTLFIDGLDKLENENFLQWLPVQLPPTLKVVLSLLDSVDATHYTTLLVDKIESANHIHLNALTIKESRHYLAHRLKLINRTLNDEQFEYVENVFATSDRSPLYLRFIFEEVKHWQSNHEHFSLALDLPSAINRFFENLTTTHYHNRILVKYILGLIISSRSGLTEKEIIDLLNNNAPLLDEIEDFNSLNIVIDGVIERRLPSSVWLRIFEQIKPFLHEKEVNGYSLLTFSNEAITTTLKQTLYDDNKRALHSDLIRYFTQHSTQRTYIELPWSLFKIDDNQSLASFLSKIDNYHAFLENNKRSCVRMYLNYLAKYDTFFVKILEEYKQLNPPSPATYNLIVALLINCRKESIVKDFLAHGMQVFHDNPEMLCGIYQKQGTINSGYARFAYIEKSVEQALKQKEMPLVEFAKLYNSLGISAKKTGQFKIAESSFQNALRVYNKNGNTALHTFYYLDVLINLANLYLDWDNHYYFDLAAQYAIYSLENIERLNVNPHFLVTTYNNLGLTFKRLLLLKESESCYKKSLRSMMEHYLHDDVRFAQTLYNFAKLYVEMEQWNKVSEYLTVTLKSLSSSYQTSISPIKQGHIISLSNQVRDFMDDLGDSQLEASDALSIYEALLDLIRKLPNNEEDIINIAYNIGVSYTKVGNYRTSLSYFILCYEQSQHFFGEKHPSTIEVLNAILSIKKHIV